MKFTWLSDVFFPMRCLVCDAHLARGAPGACCHACRSNVLVRAEAPTPQQWCDGQPTDILLGAATSYDDPTVRALIHHLKFNFVRDAAEPLGDILFSYFLRTRARMPLRSDTIIVPIPLSVRRERTRGFNQSALIARRFAHHTDLPVRETILERVRHTKPQTETASAEERRRNPHNCFIIAAHDQGIVPKDIILIDDVVTTGSTLREAARILAAAGTECIVVLAVAQATMRNHQHKDIIAATTS